jgi:hypothetical protein
MIVDYYKQKIMTCKYDTYDGKGLDGVDRAGMEILSQVLCSFSGKINVFSPKMEVSVLRGIHQEKTRKEI